MIERSWLGRRVTVRRAVHHGGAGPVRYSDAVGDLVALTADTAVVETRRGRVEVPLAEVAIAKLVPPSTADELALEAVAADGWRPAETATVGGWLLRASGGFTARANSVLPLRAPGMPLADALAAAAEWYGVRGLPLRLQVPTEARRLLDAELAERGWSTQEDVDVLTGRLDVLSAGEPTVRVEVADAPDDAWLAVYRGGAAVGSPAARDLLVRHDRAAFASVRMAGTTVAVGRGAVDTASGPAPGPWLGVSCVEVDPAHRRRGLATAVMAGLWQWGRASGATRSYLQVASSNAPAQALYARLGYRPHHRYRYRSLPG